jgi:bifunctional NMN adenylyltransferase/nudix hydrolase
MKYKASVFIGRFQPIHTAHIQIIEQALEISEIVIVSVGSAHKPKTVKNPWTAEERITMIKRALKEKLGTTQGWTDYPEEFEKRVKFIKVRDHMYNNTRWAGETFSKAVMEGATQDKETCLIGCFKDDSSWYLKMYPQWSFEEIKKVYDKENKLMNATEVRDELLFWGSVDNTFHKGLLCNTTKEDLVLWAKTPEYEGLQNESRFLKGYKDRWASAPFPPTFVTTDCIVIKSGHILLINRKVNPGRGLWALPGGFLNPDEGLKDCAIRELKEETRIKIDKAVLRRSIIESKVFDHPNRSLRGRTITHAYLIDLGEGPLPEIKAGDDASGAHWILLADMKNLEDKMFEDHNDIIQNLTSRF